MAMSLKSVVSKDRHLKLPNLDSKYMKTYIRCKQNKNLTSKHNQRTISPENAHLKPDLGVLSHNEMTLTLNTHTPLLTSQVVCICKVSGLRLQ